MKVSIIIPTLNEEQYIGHLLSSIQKQTYIPDEIFVIDGGSVDATKKIANSFKNVHFSTAKKPVGNQRTEGGKIATGDMLIFLDADVRLHENFIESVLREMKNRSLDIACPTYVSHPGNLLINTIYKLFNTLFWFAQNSMPSGAGSCICVRKDLFRRIGGFDANMHFDDIVFIRKAGKLGKFGILSSAIYVSDRRFRKYGILQTSLTYVLLSILFTFGLYRYANSIPYVFGAFNAFSKKKV